ncbi:MAG: hypothetical protein IPF99_34630 [Deltaproteobacteria bacterium]|nr:hypothetical protein [Deltaproteobacteria bacterium]
MDLSVRLTADRNQPLARLRWQLPLGASFEPFSIAIPFAALAVPTASLWDRCVAVDELDARSLAAIQAVGADLHRAFGIRDVGRIGRFLEQRMADFCVSFDDDLVSHRRAVEDEFSEILSAAAVVLAPAVPSEIRVTPCAGGRVFHLTRDDGGELIDLKGDAAAVSMQVFVARLGTEWAVVR